MAVRCNFAQKQNVCVNLQDTYVSSMEPVYPIFYWEDKLSLHCSLDSLHNRNYNEHDKPIRLDFLLNIVLFLAWMVQEVPDNLHYLPKKVVEKLKHYLVELLQKFNNYIHFKSKY